ncbi:MAG: hypothetical protein F4186_05365 [Boseongicola sp. SB0676_bin_33]|nr:hypothetical protein [Boseongicola sp. SB0676_bin_33]
MGGANWNRFTGKLRTEAEDALVTNWSNDGELHDACWAGIGRRGPLRYDIPNDCARSMLMRLHRADPRVPLWMQEELETRRYFPFRTALREDALLGPILSEHANVRAAVDAWFEEEKFSTLHSEAAQVAAVQRSDAAKKAMLKKVADPGEFRFWPIWSLLHGWGINDSEVAAALEPLPWLPPEERQHVAHTIPAIVESVDESFRLLMEICDLPEVTRMDFVIRGFAALGNEIDEEQVVSAMLPHFDKPASAFMGEERLIARFHADPRVKKFALHRLWEPSPPLETMARAYGSDSEVAPLILERAAPLPKMFRRHIARRASQRFDDKALRQVLERCGMETDVHAMVQATIGLSYAALAAPGEAVARTEALRRQLYATGSDFDEQRVAAFGGLLSLGRVDVFADSKEGYGDEVLRIGLGGQIGDYTPVIGLAADRWEEVEAAMGNSAVGRLNQWSDDPSAFWEAFASYAGRSSRLRMRFLEHCEDESSVLQASGLAALSRLKPGSSLLLDCCKRVLATDFDGSQPSSLDAARATVAASKLLAAHFLEDSSAVAAIVAASDGQRSRGAALVGLASRWPDHEIVVREYGSLLEERSGIGLLVCVQLWLWSAQGSREQIAKIFARFAERRASSSWDFPEDSLDAFRARLEREPETADVLTQLAIENDQPSVRASAVRLLASTSTTQGRDLARKLLVAECRRSGPPRFARDVLTNRIRPVRELMREVLRTSSG